jgi:hypothetical protein
VSRDLHVHVLSTDSHFRAQVLDGFACQLRQKNKRFGVGAREKEQRWCGVPANRAGGATTTSTLDGSGAAFRVLTREVTDSRLPLHFLAQQHERSALKRRDKGRAERRYQLPPTQNLREAEAIPRTN